MSLTKVNRGSVVDLLFTGCLTNAEGTIKVTTALRPDPSLNPVLEKLFGQVVLNMGLIAQYFVIGGFQQLRAVVA
jgi:hypothetical protein